jgi:hypothetical protein
MYNYTKTIGDLPKDTKLSFIATKEIRINAASEMLRNRQPKTKYKIDNIKTGLGDSAEFKGV